MKKFQWEKELQKLEAKIAGIPVKIKIRGDVAIAYYAKWGRDGNGNLLEMLEAIAGKTLEAIDLGEGRRGEHEYNVKPIPGFPGGLRIMGEWVEWVEIV